MENAVFSCLGETEQRTVRTERYRLIQHPGGQLELYDHATDPAEDHNMAHDPAHAAILNRLEDGLNAGWRAAQPAETRR